MTAQDSLHFLLDYECLLFYCDWLGSDLRAGHFFYDDEGRLHSDSINYVSSLYKSGTNRIEITIPNISRYCVFILCCGNAC
jgi:hypothetical protein